ncbi:hypothetical protein COS81_00540 [candidate division WWE3 bacterium CG06_land_8_20_14_3_00_42_16]|nr:MAG: hypothetical protein COS81_00540 [candidate division WWE3 bacterium CG06_land_8_20_14_3_00_42_16]
MIFQPKNMTMIRETLFVAIPIGLLGYILKFLGFAINIVEYSPNNHILNYQSKLFGYILNYFTVINFKNLSPQQKYERIQQELNLAIHAAQSHGDYRCCINPPCTMCYLSPNPWNNFTAGTCACDDLIA